MRLSPRWLAFAAGAATLAAAQSDPCTEFAEKTAKAPAYSNLDAKLFRKCITAVPFNKDKATATLDMVRRFMGLSSSAFYYADPTPELELQPFNINKTLDALEEKVKNGGYDNNWSFDYDVVQMFQLFRDRHTDYETVCTHGYFYTHDYPIAAIQGSSGMPEIHHVIIERSSSTTRAKLGAKITRINGQDPGIYMAEFIKSSPEALDFVDPDARFNAMVYNWPGGANRGKFAYRNMWNGEDLRITWENGTETKVEFSLSLGNGLVDKETSELVFSDTKTLGEACWKSDLGTALKRRSEAEKRDPAKPALRKRDTAGRSIPSSFPKALDNSIENVMSTYALPSDSSTVVLVIRSFSSNTNADSSTFIKSFSEFLQTQLLEWKSKGYTRLIIDVTSNSGGNAILPIDLLEQFFSSSEEFLTVNMAYSPVTWAYMQSVLSGNEYKNWQKLDGTDFANMTDFLGPVRKDGSLFSKMWQQDYVQYGEDMYGFKMTGYPPTSPFMPDDIAIVSDALCASACSSFVEGMRTRGVRVYAYGGRATQSRPMQGVGGTKGGRYIDYSNLKARLDAVATDESVAAIAGDPDTWLLPDSPVNLEVLSINTENKFRKGYTVPMHFLYTPACNRFYLTKEMWDDVTKMWEKVREMAWDVQGKVVKCVEYKWDKDSKMPGYLIGANGIEKGTGASGQVGYDAFDEGEALDGSGRASQNDPSATGRREEKTYRNLGQVIWRHMGRK